MVLMWQILYYRTTRTKARLNLATPHRISGFSYAWEKAIVAEQGNVGYLEVLRFCW